MKKRPSFRQRPPGKPVQRAQYGNALLPCGLWRGHADVDAAAIEREAREASAMYVQTMKAAPAKARQHGDCTTEPRGL